MSWNGTVVDIFVGAKSEPLEGVDSAVAVAGEGLEGDRKYGTRPGDPGTEITLIEAEAIEAIAREHDLVIQPIDARRNVLTRDVPLNHLVGREFTIGNSVRLRGIRLCEPCGHLEKMTQPGVREALVHRGGLRAQIVSGGPIARGDRVGPVDTPET